MAVCSISSSSGIGSGILRNRPLFGNGGEKGRKSDQNIIEILKHFQLIHS